MRVGEGHNPKIIKEKKNTQRKKSKSVSNKKYEDVHLSASSGGNEFSMSGSSSAACYYIQHVPSQGGRVMYRSYASGGRPGLNPRNECFSLCRHEKINSDLLFRVGLLAKSICVASWMHNLHSLWSPP